MNSNINNPFRISGGIFSFTALLFFSLFINPLLSQPKMEWESTKHNFGAVKRGAVVRVTYKVRNTGSAPLLLQRAEFECSCTSAEITQQPIMPGQSGTLTLIFNTATVYGRQDRVAEIISNVPGEPVRLRYKANVSRN